MAARDTQDGSYPGEPICYGRGGSSRPPGSGLILDMKDMSDSVGRFIESGEWKVWLHWFVWRIALPTIVCMALLYCLVYICHKIYRWLLPHTAAELHQQALQALQPTSRKQTSVPSTPDKNDTTTAAHDKSKKRTQALQQRQKASAEDHR